MAHGSYSKRRVNTAGRRSKSALGPEKKPKSVTLKNQIRSIERMLLKVLPHSFFPISSSLTVIPFRSCFSCGRFSALSFLPPLA
ncbi:hypothetical protein TB2_038383 [Malus domestica]